MTGFFQPNVFQNNVFQTDSVAAVTPAGTSGGSGGIASSTARRPAVYVDGFRRVRKELAEEPPEIKTDTAEPKRAEPAPLVPLLLNKLANPADELRAREIARQLEIMRDDDEAVALLLLN